MNILVTGSKGFVGSRLVKELRGKGYRVREFDTALGNNVSDLEQCRQAVKRTDVVYHLAAVLDEKSALLKIVNVHGTENMLEAAAEQHCKQFVYLSTAGVHAGVKGVVSEESEFKPATPYEKSKAEAERLVQDFQEMLPITVVRSALVLGPNQYWEQIVGLVKKGFPLIGGGKQNWQTVYIDDLVDALMFVLMNKDCFSETFVVAEQGKHSLRELYAEIQSQLGMEVKVKAVPAVLAKIGIALKGTKGIVSKEHVERLARTRNYDTGKINALGWKAKTGMQEAVKGTVATLKAEGII